MEENFPHASVQTTDAYLGCKQNLGHPVNDLFQLVNIALAVQASFWNEAEVLTAKTRCGQPDKISVNESGGDQEGSDERAGTSFQRDGHASV
jgi:hypothetical protein